MTKFHTQRFNMISEDLEYSVQVNNFYCQGLLLEGIKEIGYKAVVLQSQT